MPGLQLRTRGGTLVAYLYGNRQYLVAYSENERARAVRMFALLHGLDALETG